MPKPKSKPKYEIECLDPEEVRALLHAICNINRKRQYPTSVRNRALIALLYRSGLRCFEALDLAPDDVSEARGTIIVRHGKGDKRRIVGMDEGGFEELNRWREVRPVSPYLFCTLKGGHLDSGYAREMIKRKGKEAGITKRVHLHGLRHTHAGELALESVPLNLIQAQLGHARLSTTEGYLRGIASQNVTVIRQRTWT